MAAIWHRAGCCCVVACEHCDADTTPPRKITLVVAGITACGCFPVSDTYHMAISMPASVDVVNTVADPCIWQATAGTLTRTIYADPGCSGAVLDATTWSVAWSLVKAAGQWEMSAGVTGADTYGITVFWDIQAETDCSNGVTFTNDWAVGDCGTPPGGPSSEYVAAYGGTITKAVT